MLELVVESEQSRCPDDGTLETLASDSLEPWDRGALERHLLGCSTCRERLAAVVMGSAEKSPLAAQFRSSRPDPPDLPQAGDVIAGKFRVDGVIGRGGMGVVLAARHLELGHRLAIKVLRSTSPNAGSRFLREARTSVRLVSDHVVRVFDYGRLEQGSPFLVMEYLQGEDLARVLASGPVPIATAIRYVSEVCEALEEAHGLGVVHRDLKPGNLFVVGDAKGDTRIKVLDFGISKWLDSEFAGASALTESDAVIGSPLYMSPEQVRASRDVDLRSDIWSLGVVFYELLAGRSPFAAPSVPAVSLKIASSAPESLTTQREGVSAALEAVVLRCLEKDPAARFQSVSALAQALAALPAEPHPARPRASGVLLALVAVLALGGLLFVLLDLESQPRRAADRTQPATVETTPARTQPEPAQPTAAPPVTPPHAHDAADAPSKPAPRNTAQRTLDIGDVLPP